MDNADPDRDWDALWNETISARAGNATLTAAAAEQREEVVYKIASSRERLDEKKKSYVDTMNRREENLVSLWGSEAGLLGALGVVGLILCFYIFVGVSGGLNTPRSTILIDEAPSAYEEGERLLRSLE